MKPMNNMKMTTVVKSKLSSHAHSILTEQPYMIRIKTVQINLFLSYNTDS